MIKQYIKQAWQLMKQNRFFSFVYIIGTGLAISMVMVMAIAWHIRTANMAPEVNREKVLYATFLRYWQEKNGSKSSSNGYFGIRSAKECLLPLKSAKAVGVATDPTVMSLLAGDSYAQISGGDNVEKVSMMGTNDGFWKVFNFSFVDGKPFDEADFQSGMHRAVLSVSLARGLFGSEDVVGQTFLLDDVEYTISGVVKDVSAITPSVCANIWVPYTSLSSIAGTESNEKDASVGFLAGYILPADGVSQQEVVAELDGLIQRYNSTLQGGKIEQKFEPSSHKTHVIYQFIGGIGEKKVTTIYIILALLLFLFLLIPALNLSGLNASHMQDRMAELGVRKAFGANRKGVFVQILIENMLLMLPGGIVGLLLSYSLIAFFQKLLLAPGIIAMLKGEVDTQLTTGMLMNFSVFGYAFLACLVLNILSSMIPVWRAVRVNIIDALHN